MTDTEKMLALARAVFPERDVAENGLDGRTWITTIDGAPSPWVPFDPANNSEQALALLCWLGTQTDFSVCDDGRDFMLWDKHDDLLLSEPYSNPAEWRAAVRKAALRVA